MTKCRCRVEQDEWCAPPRPEPSTTFSAKILALPLLSLVEDAISREPSRSRDRLTFFRSMATIRSRFSMTDGQPLPPTFRRGKSGNALIVIYWDRETGLGGRWTSPSVPGWDYDPRSPLDRRYDKARPLPSCFLLASLLRCVDEAVRQSKSKQNPSGRGVCARETRDRGTTIDRELSPRSFDHFVLDDNNNNNNKNRGGGGGRGKEEWE